MLVFVLSGSRLGHVDDELAARPRRQRLGERVRDLVERKMLVDADLELALVEQFDHRLEVRAVRLEDHVDEFDVRVVLRGRREVRNRDEEAAFFEDFGGVEPSIRAPTR